MFDLPVLSLFYDFIPGPVPASMIVPAGVIIAVSDTLAIASTLRGRLDFRDAAAEKRVNHVFYSPDY